MSINNVYTNLHTNPPGSKSCMLWAPSSAAAAAATTTRSKRTNFDQKELSDDELPLTAAAVTMLATVVQVALSIRLTNNHTRSSKLDSSVGGDVRKHTLRFN